MGKVKISPLNRVFSGRLNYHYYLIHDSWFSLLFTRFCVAIILCVVTADVVISLHNTIRPAGVVIHHSALPADEGLAELAYIHKLRGFGAFFGLKPIASAITT
ncbi:hypothetical protein FTO74_04835 [Granulicella sp. WH15]|uniref:hypothetical protein n=1 Tax=Granulicella sp. WH15 TaxID=2602070 RepID=UPI0013670C9A|nr:hypothetical protein [Granulicella sp. WH15]QHN02771.1 hypothetical protein FTO74_04835 [Granulicella sp. WH15]